MAWDDAQEIYDQTIKNEDFSHQEVRGKTFNACTFRECSFQETLFLACTFQDCAFEHCDLSLMKVKGSRFQQVTYTHCQLTGVNWSDAAAARLAVQTPLRFISCGLNYATFIGQKFRGIVIRDCAARDVDFSDADLENAKFCGSDLTNSRFTNTNLSGADFRGAQNYLISPTLNKIRGAHFSLPEAIGLLHGLDIHLDEED